MNEQYKNTNDIEKTVKKQKREDMIQTVLAVITSIIIILGIIFYPSIYRKTVTTDSIIGTIVSKEDTIVTSYSGLGVKGTRLTYEDITGELHTISYGGSSKNIEVGKRYRITKITNLLDIRNGSRVKIEKI